MSRILPVAAATTLFLGALGALAMPAEAAPVRSTWIVVLDDDVTDVAAHARQHARAHDGRVGFLYQHALKGFSVEVTAQAASAIARSERVAYVEPDRVMSVVEQVTPTGISRSFAPGNTGIDIDSVDDVRVDVDVAVIDTGIDLDHPDLNVVGSTDCTNESGGPPWSRTAECLAGGDDDHGHGTHVAGSAAALDNGLGVVGMAPGARLWAVKVLEANGSGSNAMVIAGIDWVADRASTIKVANMSLGGGKSQALNDAVAGAVGAGVTMVVAAGNSSADAANSSPASEPKAITVSALADFNGQAGGGAAPTCRTDVDDTFADFSNYGTVVDIIAPGVCILSTVPGGYDTFSGTSMASPHVAGAAALLRSMGKTHATTESELKASGNLDWNNSDDKDSVKERLLDVSNTTVFAPRLVSVGGGEPVNAAPSASFTFGCTELSCSFDGSGSADSDGTLTSYEWDFGDDTSTGSGVSVNHTYAVSGSFTVTLTVTDDDLATDQESASVSVSDGSGGTLAFVGSSVSNGSSWTAVVSVSGAAAGQVVAGTWESGATGSCTANLVGTCDIVRSGIAKRVRSVTWTHTDPVTNATTAVVITKP